MAKIDYEQLLLSVIKRTPMGEDNFWLQALADQGLEYIDGKIVECKKIDKAAKAFQNALEADMKERIERDKQLLLKDLCARLPYGVKILHEGWDSDRGCEYETIEDLIGIDDRFIYTLWRGERDKHSILEPLSITDYKPYLRPMSSMTKKEKEEYYSFYFVAAIPIHFADEIVPNRIDIPNYEVFDWLNAHYFDYRGLIEKGLAIEAPEGMYNLKV